jgi:hypothetical protein
MRHRLMSTSQLEFLDKQQDHLKAKRKAANDRNKEMIKKGDAIVSPKDVVAHRTATKRAASGKQRVFARLRSRIGFKNKSTSNQ